MTTPKYYAGIGSRETPEQIRPLLEHCGSFLCEQGWTLRSGAADNADAAFEKGADRLFKTELLESTKETDITNDPIRPEPKEIYLPWRGYNGSISQLHPGNYPFTADEVSLAKKFHPAWEHCSQAARKMHTRNVRIMRGLHGIPVKFVVCWTAKGLVAGGTGQALRIAEAAGIPIINFGQATSAQHLEALLLEIDRLQGTF